MPPEIIIAGQGLAGSLLSWQLIRAGAHVTVIDPGFNETSSRIATGMMNPVTGRRIVKSWLAELFIPYAKESYSQLEALTGASFFHECNSLEIYTDAGHRNEWLSRSDSETISPFIKGECKPADVPEGVFAPFGGMYMQNGGWLDCKTFLNSYRDYLIKNNLLVCDHVDEEAVRFDPGKVYWKDRTADIFVDCRGASSKDSSWFHNLPFNLNKGEVFHFTSNLTVKDILHRSVKVINTHADNFICGATYSWDPLDHEPTEEGINQLQELMEKFINVPYTITSKHAAVRPSTNDRRPFMGRHPVIHPLTIFNGLGSKGVMIAPLLAAYMSEFLLHHKPLPAETDINRFRTE